MNDAPEKFGRNRQFEFTMGLGLATMGSIILGWPDSVENTAYSAIIKVISAFQLGIVYVLVGCSRVVALIFNGKLGKAAPVIRLICAAMSVVVLGQMVAAFVEILPDRGVPSPSMGFYFVLMVSECYAVHRIIERG